MTIIRDVGLSQMTFKADVCIYFFLVVSVGFFKMCMHMVKVQTPCLFEIRETDFDFQSCVYS